MTTNPVQTVTVETEHGPKEYRGLVTETVGHVEVRDPETGRYLMVAERAFVLGIKDEA